MDYNTQRKRLILPEYGRNIQKMIDHALTIEDKEERNKAAKTIIDVMGNLYPHLRDVPDFRHKLWDHIAIMSDFKLDIDTPYPLPSIEELNEKPEKIPYSTNRIKFKHYGKTVERYLSKLDKLENEEDKKSLLTLIANHMKKSFLIWKKDSVEDIQIMEDLSRISDVGELKEDINLSGSKELLTKRSKTPKKGYKPFQKHR